MLKREKYLQGIYLCCSSLHHRPPVRGVAGTSFWVLIKQARWHPYGLTPSPIWTVAFMTTAVLFLIGTVISHCLARDPYASDHQSEWPHKRWRESDEPWFTHWNSLNKYERKPYERTASGTERANSRCITLVLFVQLYSHIFPPWPKWF